MKIWKHNREGTILSSSDSKMTVQRHGSNRKIKYAITFETNYTDIDDTDIKIERAHRLPSRNSPKPIIVKFSLFKDKDSVLRAYRQKRKDENNENVNDDNDGNNKTVRRIRVTEDFPERVVKARTKLFPFLKSCMDDEVNAYLRYDSLVVDGQPYIYDYELKRPVPSNK